MSRTENNCKGKGIIHSFNFYIPIIRILHTLKQRQVALYRTGPMTSYMCYKYIYWVRPFYGVLATPTAWPRPLHGTGKECIAPKARRMPALVDHRVIYSTRVNTPIRTTENFEAVEWATGFSNENGCIEACFSSPTIT